MRSSTAQPRDNESIAQAADLLQSADALVVAAGAGMGVDSGLPDFRGSEGFWRAYPALRDAGLDFTQIASPSAFVSTPERTWGFYGHRLALYRTTQPHAGFQLLRKWGDAMPHGLFTYTSNVDGQFQRAAFDPVQVHECHGSIHHLQCLKPCSDAIWPADEFMPQVDEAQCLLLNEPPHCPRCGGLARPNILMFGDSGWLEHRSRAQSARLGAWLRRINRPVVIELGAGTAIPSVRQFSHRVLCDHNGRLIRINPTDCRVPTSRDVGLPLGARAALEGIAGFAADWGVA